MNFTEDSEELRIRHVPVRAFILGGALASITGALFLWMLYPLFTGASIASKLLAGGWTELIATAIFGLVFLAMLFSFIKTPVVTVTISHKSKSVEAHFGQIFGSHADRYYFTQIKNFRSYQDGESSIYYLGLILLNNDEIHLKAALGKDKDERTRIVKKLNKFIKPPKPSKKTAAKQSLTEDL